MFEGLSLPYTYRLILFALCVGIACGGNKKDTVPLDLNSFQKDKRLPIVLVTSKGVLNEKTGQIDAPKRITLLQGGAKITADAMRYIPKTNTICAKGHVEILHANGTIAYCDTIALNLDKNTGALSMVRALSPNRERISAKTMTHAGEQTKLTMGSYTPCGLCKDQINPMWSIHAREMVWDRTKKRTHYTDAHFSVFGTPLFYLPSFSIPTTRASGIVAPDVGMNGQIGGYVGIPYFWAMHPQHDMTFTPYITQRGGPIFATEYRGRTQRHKTTVQGAINPFANGWTKTQQNKDLNILAKDQDIPSTRGFVHGKSVVNLNDFWRFSGEQWFVSDKAFLETRNLFGQSQATFLPSNATLECFGQHHYLNIQALNYRGLRPEDQQKMIPFILPEVNYDYTSMPLWHNSTFSFRGNLLSLQRQEGVGMQRACGDIEWLVPGLTSWGQTWEGFVRGRMRCYGVFQDGTMQVVPHRGVYWLPQIGMTARWPVMMRGVGRINPVVQVILGTNPTHPTHSINPVNPGDLPIPNEDSQSIIFDESNFFSKYRFAGYDASDYGSRINYGLDISRDYSMGVLHVFMGQSYGLTQPNALLESVGVRLGRSDYVGQVDVQSDCAGFMYRFRLDCQTGALRFQEIGCQGGPSWAVISTSYAFGKRDTGVLRPETYQSNYNQLAMSIVSNIGNRWAVKAFATHDFGEHSSVQPVVALKEKGFAWDNTSPKLMDCGGGIRYNNECFSGEFTIQKSYYKAQEMRPGWTFSFSIQLKSIGGFTQRSERFSHGLNQEW